MKPLRYKRTRTTPCTGHEAIIHRRVFEPRCAARHAIHASFLSRDNWDSSLPFVQLAYNTWFQRDGTRNTVLFPRFKRPARLLVDIIFEGPARRPHVGHPLKFSQKTREKVQLKLLLHSPQRIVVRERSDDSKRRPTNRCPPCSVFQPGQNRLCTQTAGTDAYYS